MTTLGWIALVLAINYLIGSFICSRLDKDGRYLSWLEKDPTGGIVPFLFIELWPIAAFLMLRYR